MPTRIIDARVEGADDLARDLRRLGERAKPHARKAVREASLGLERRIKTEMPVLTGLARATWGHWTPDSLIGGALKALKGLQAAGEKDSHWVERDGGLTIEQGSNLEYIEALENGHSQQAPAGFIAKAVLAAQKALTDYLGEILRGF